MADTDASIGYGITFEMADLATPTDMTYIAEVKDVTPPSDETDQADASHMQSPNRSREFIDGLTDPGEASFEMNYVPGSPSDKALIAAKGKRKWCRLTFPNGVQTLFVGSRQTYEKSAPLDDVMTATVTFKVSGDPVHTDPTAPRNISAPTITGTAKVGAPLVVDPGIWAGSMRLEYQWKAAAAAITGATGLSYVPVAGDIGDTITCEVTAYNEDFNTMVASAATAAVIA
ncbi:phage tail tube protein [Sinorhizobium meliloti]|uniref:phage tail tube protein n=1 Tax=Rhizobium meliloti TaxID=382 RepID=UPI000FE110E1|nr:phage tail tube protein [Sinorhizobium meliloti]RVL53955.1 histidine kinase [Sinorhizobium meliloti]